MNLPCGPQARPVRRSVHVGSGPLKWPTRCRPVHETAHDGGILRALALLQNRPRTSPELQLSPNAISPWLT